MSTSGDHYIFTQVKQISPAIEATVTVDFNVNWPDLIAEACGTVSPTGFITVDSTEHTGDSTDINA